MTTTIMAPKTHKHLDTMRALLQGGTPPPVANLIGFTMLDVDLGRTVFELVVSERHWNPMGTLHGGILCDLGDAAMGCAMVTTIEDDETYTSLDLTVKFLKPIRAGKLRATGTVMKRTRSIGLVECDIVDDKDSLVAHLISSCMVLRGDDAKGR